jgi:hypothetical protein
MQYLKDKSNDLAMNSENKIRDLYNRKKKKKRNSRGATNLEVTL